MILLMAHDLPRTRAESIRLGSTHYFTGRPCKHGHFSRRLSPSGDCLECKKLQLRAYRRADPALAYATTKRYRERNPEAVRAARRKHYESRSSHYKAQAKARAEQMREILAAYAAKWRQDNPGRVTAYANERRCAKIRRTPSWTELDDIRRFYELCPVGHHVDHVLPLRGKYVSGLHVLQNLQYLPADVNRNKGNRYHATWPTPGFETDITRARAGLAAFESRA